MNERMKEKIRVYSLGMTIMFFYIILLCVGATVGFLIGFLIHTDIRFIIAATVGFLLSALYLFVLICGRKIVIDYNKKEIRYWEVLGLDILGIPLLKRIRLDRVQDISTEDNQLLFLLLSGGTIRCKARQSLSSGSSTSHNDKLFTAELAKKLKERFFASA
ncbi:MAG: hypothetical protein FWH03_07550 [Firmicutes bacterium]|nr:hypothetical protein [Bacillota bacterium]